MRAAFVLVTIAVALILGVAAGASQNGLLAHVLAIGFVPALWGAAHVVERWAGRDLWHFTAPYPDGLLVR